MKEDELREAAVCAVCGDRIMTRGMPLFWRVRLTRYGLDWNALQQQQGLTMMLGGHAALARIMGPDNDLAKPMGDPIEVTVCERCAGEGKLVLYELWGKAVEKAAAAEKKADG